MNDELFKQIDGVAMGSPLGPTLSNIIMTTFEDEIVRQLIDSNVIKFYARYVDDTLVLAKPSDIPIILRAFNSFHPQIQFTFEDFPDNNVHFLDLKINSSDITIFRKFTHTDQYTHISSFTPWSRKTAWITALINRTYKICNNDQLLKLELKAIREFMSWNGFSHNLTKKLINAFTPNPESNNNIPHVDHNNIPHAGDRGSFRRRGVQDIWKNSRFLS
jgi:5-methylcytosine-specific restriction endonuclease McrA